MGWSADTVQAVVFTRPGQRQPDSLEFWEALFHSTPDGFSKPTGTPNSFSTASGKVDATKIQLNSQVGRVDIFLTAEGQGNSEAPPQISDYENAIKQVAEYGEILSRNISTNRVALVTRLSEKIEAKDIHEKFLQLLPNIEFPVDSIDRVYQINRRRSMEFCGIEFNRLCTWATMMQQFLMLSNNSEMISQTTSMFATLTIDVNTSGVLTEDLDIAPVWEELVNENISFSRFGYENFND